MKKRAEWNIKGFTILEVIITLVAVAVVGAMMFNTLGTSMMKSSDPIFRMQTSLSLQQIIENFVTAYEKYYAGDLPALRDAIAGGVLNPPGNEGAVLDNTFGEYTIVENRFIKFNASHQEETAAPTDPQNLLKVTIKNSNGEILTYIFAG
ncbi:MAG: type II secretion system protein [Deltaproteobacteria bacterium]|nr:type II secretion system protein [Deltaproteobacteria bacterium]